MREEGFTAIGQRRSKYRLEAWFADALPGCCFHPIGLKARFHVIECEAGPIGTDRSVEYVVPTTKSRGPHETPIKL